MKSLEIDHLLRCAAALCRCGVRQKYASLPMLGAPCSWSYWQSLLILQAVFIQEEL